MDRLTPHFLSVGLRTLLALQRRPLRGLHAEALREAAQLSLAPAEAASEVEIDALRAALKASAETIQMQDFGAGTQAGLLAALAKPDERRIAEIYERAAATPAWGRFLFCLVRALRPRHVLELGANLGVSAAHIVAALDHNHREGGEEAHLVTLEGDPTLANLAREHLVPTGRATVVTGRFVDTLPEVLATRSPFDLVFLDGHHEEAATLQYFAMIRPHLAPGACVVFDDIEPTRPVRRAWKRVLTEEPSSGHADLLGLGLWFAPFAEADAKVPRKASAAVQ
ncbi:MAG: class I SAM-dependent methyltransferase [Rhodothermaceae bacterium]|nr:class I SAM-dependent methyltransferase [Rhodothermaceae bacterium]